MDDSKETGRVEAFSDGVFAVAITLLVLNIQPPSLSTPQLLVDSAHQPVGYLSLVELFTQGKKLLDLGL